MSEMHESAGLCARGVKGLLLTVGGTAAPLVHSLARVQPEAVVFVCSEETQATVVAVKQAAAADRSPQQTPRHKTLIVDDPANLIDCHRRVSEGLDWLRGELGLHRDEIRIDFTGGTKAMSAAAVLAAAPDGYRFLYVSGTARDKNGVGVVVSGEEDLRLPENPWTVLEEPEIRRLLEMAALGQWSAAEESVRRLIDRSTERGRPVFETLRRVLQGLAAWDRYEHAAAWKSWNDGQAPTSLANLATAGGYSLLTGFAKKCQPLAQQLGPLVNSPERIGTGPDGMVLDMLGNGDRQALRGHYDEAALRYYRAVELCVERRLRILHQTDNGEVREDQVPSPLREELLDREGKPAPVWKLGQFNSAKLLAALGDGAGTRLLARLVAKKLDCQARNDNWLIHGTAHVDQRRFMAFKTSVLDALTIPEQKVPAWPDFRP